MNPALAAIAIAILAGAIGAVFVRDARIAILSLAVVLLIAPFLADPIAPASGLVARLLGAVLATYLVWIAVRDGAFQTGGSRLGWPADANVARTLGIIGLISTALYALPRTSVLGAILLTGYLGGAIATNMRVGSPLFSHTLFSVYLGIILWGGLYLRDPRVRALIPFGE